MLGHRLLFVVNHSGMQFRRCILGPNVAKRIHLLLSSIMPANDFSLEKDLTSASLFYIVVRSFCMYVALVMELVPFWFPLDLQKGDVFSLSSSPFQPS